MKSPHLPILPLNLIPTLVIACLMTQQMAFGNTQSAGDLCKSGDICDQKFDARSALPLYLSAEKLDPSNGAILVRIAREYRYLMADAPSKGEKLHYGYLALDYSQRAASIAPNNAEAQLSVAITYGKLLPFLGTKAQVDASPKIKAAVDCTLRLDPHNDTAWHILGRWNRVLADVPGVKRALAGAVYGQLPKGSNEEAEKCLRTAISLNKGRLMHFVELGRVYAQMGRVEEARGFINRGLDMPNREKDDPETKERGRDTLAKLR